MFKATLKGLLSRKLRLVLSALAVVLGVMFVSGAFVLTDNFSRSFDSLFSSVYETVDVQVDAKPRLTTNDGSQPVTDPIPASVLDTVQGVPGVAKVRGTVFADNARMIGRNGKLVAGQQRFGTNWTSENPIVELRSGREPAADGEIVINQALADASKYKVGDSVGVLTLQPKRTFTIVGVFGYTGDRSSIGGEHTIAFTTPVAQELLLGQSGVFTSVDVRAASGVSATELRDRVRSSMGDGYQVRTGDELAKEASNSIKTALNFVTYILLGFAAVSLFVGVFLIINTFSIIVAQRTRELALMRALGASGGQVINSVIIEAVVIGLIASVVGLGAGVGIGALLMLLVGSALPSVGLSVPLTAVIASFAVGLGVTLAAAIFPALRASRIPPIAAMRDAANTTKSLTTVTVSGAVVTALGAAGLWLGLSGAVSGGSFWLVFGGGLAFAFVGIALLTPVISRPIVSGLGRVLSWSMPGKLGRRNSARNPRRTAITAAALMVGIALVTGVSVILTSAKSSVSKALDTGVSAELIIAGQQTGPLPPTFDPAVVAKTRNVPGVRSVADLYFDGAEINDRNSFVYATNDLPAMADIMHMKAVSGTLAAPSGDQLVIDERTAKNDKLAVGGTVKIQTVHGDAVTYTVAGVYKDIQALTGYILPGTAVKNFRNPNPAQAYIKLVDGADANAVQAQVDTLLADSPEVDVSDRSSYVKQQTSILDTILTMIQVLLAMAIIIAVLGVINTLALSMIERTRELGLLRAVGMSRGQIMGMVTVESVVISVFGALLGIAVGVSLGAAVVQALKDQGFSTFALPWGQMITYVVLAAVVGVIAAIIPAIRAARTDILRAISYE